MPGEDLWIAWICGIGGVLIFIFAFVGVAIGNKKAKKEEPQEEEEEEIPETQFVRATVLSKRVYRAYDYHVAPGVAESNLYFFILFRKENGEEVEFSVPQELFEKTEEGQSATLVTIGNSFIDFGDGEEMYSDKE